MRNYDDWFCWAHGTIEIPFPQEPEPEEVERPVRSAEAMYSRECTVCGYIVRADSINAVAGGISRHWRQLHAENAVTDARECPCCGQMRRLASDRPGRPWCHSCNSHKHLRTCTQPPRTPRDAALRGLEWVE